MTRTYVLILNKLLEACLKQIYFTDGYLTDNSNVQFHTNYWPP